MEAVATASGVPRPTLYKRFPDKQALLKEVLQSQILKWKSISAKRQANPDGDLGDRLAHRLAILMTWAMKAEVRAVTNLAFDGLRSEGKRAARENFFAHNDMIDVIIDDIVQDEATQALSAEKAERIAQALMTLVSGWLDRQDNKKPVPAGVIRREARFFVDLITLGRQAW